MKMTITGQIDGKSVLITIPIEKVIEAFWPYATKPSALSVSTELDADGISANFMLGQETKDSYPGIWLTSKNSNTGRAGSWFCLELPNETNDMVKAICTLEMMRRRLTSLLPLSLMAFAMRTTSRSACFG